MTIAVRYVHNLSCCEIKMVFRIFSGKNWYKLGWRNEGDKQKHKNNEHDRSLLRVTAA